MGVKSSKAAKLFNSVQKSQVSWKRIKPYLTPYYDKNTSFHVQENENTLMFDNLSFIYPNSRDYVINNLSFTGNKGEIVGITGPIASGKSTLGKIILGFYPYFGSIKIYNKELSDYSEFERSQMISYLGHKAELLSDTIYNNITLGNNKDIKQVLSDVCFDEDLEKMPYKEQTLVGNNGVRLSGGQQARIALARTLLNKNKIIILDDPFSAVDMKTEEKIINNLKANYKDSLIILISHRLSIFPSLDKIIFLNSDKSYFIGTHEEIFKTSNLYQTIYNLQETSGDRHE
jgi:ABC-type multidrug transport system fused ATPase/permease subunit